MNQNVKHATLLFGCVLQLFQAVSAEPQQGNSGSMPQAAAGLNNANQAAPAALGNRAPGAWLRQRLLQRFDGNHNGTLDQQEKAAIQSFIQQRRGQGGGPLAKAGGMAGGGARAGANSGALPGGGQIGGGGLSGDGEIAARLRQRFDKNGNGSLDGQEFNALRAFIQQKRQSMAQPDLGAGQRQVIQGTGAARDPSR